jgi:hypothetical protein
LSRSFLRRAGWQGQQGTVGGNSLEPLLSTYRPQLAPTPCPSPALLPPSSPQ